MISESQFVILMKNVKKCITSCDDDQEIEKFQEKSEIFDQLDNIKFSENQIIQNTYQTVFEIRKKKL